MSNIFKKLISRLKRQDKHTTEEQIVEQSDKPIILPDLTTDIDISKIVDLSQQKLLCSNMLDIIEVHESKLRNRFIGAQTVTDFIESDRRIREEMGEFIGYHFGCITSTMFMVEAALVNLKRFEEGDFDDIDAPARGMFVSMWYNIALSNIDLLDTSMKQIENIEAELIHQQMELTGSNEIILKRGTMH